MAVAAAGLTFVTASLLSLIRLRQVHLAQIARRCFVAGLIVAFVVQLIEGCVIARPGDSGAMKYDRGPCGGVLLDRDRRAWELIGGSRRPCRLASTFGSTTIAPYVALRYRLIARSSGPGGIDGPRQDHRCGRCALCSVPLARPPIKGTLAWPGHGANAVYRPYSLSVPREDREGPGQINEYRPR